MGRARASLLTVQMLCELAVNITQIRQTKRDPAKLRDQKSSASGNWTPEWNGKSGWGPDLPTQSGRRLASVLFCFLTLLRGMQDLSSLTRDQTHAPCSGSVESQPLDHQGNPKASVWQGGSVQCLWVQAVGSDSLVPTNQLILGTFLNLYSFNGNLEFLNSNKEITMFRELQEITCTHCL